MAKETMKTMTAVALALALGIGVGGCSTGTTQSGASSTPSSSSTVDLSGERHDVASAYGKFMTSMLSLDFDDVNTLLSKQTTELESKGDDLSDDDVNAASAALVKAAPGLELLDVTGLNARSVYASYAITLYSASAMATEAMNASASPSSLSIPDEAVTMVDEKTATIDMTKATFGGSAGSGTIHMTKVDGEWKVQSAEEDDSQSGSQSGQ